MGDGLRQKSSGWDQVVEDLVCMRVCWLENVFDLGRRCDGVCSGVKTAPAYGFTGKNQTVTLNSSSKYGHPR